MNKTWLASGLALILGVAWIASSGTANAQQRKAVAKAVKKAPAKKVVAKKKAPPKVVPKALPKVTTVSLEPIVIPAGANTLGAHAALYAAYANDVDSLAVRSVLSGPALTTSTEKIARHLNSQRLAMGIVAYGAAYAATNDQFVAEARKAAAYFGRDAFIAKLRREYSYARVLPGGEQAAQLAAQAILADAAKIQTEGDDFKQAAYDWQALAWGKLSTVDAIARNAALRLLVPAAPSVDLAMPLSALPEATTTPETTAARHAALARTSRISSSTNREAITLAEPIRAWSPIDRMVSLAALAAIGAPIDKQEDTEALMKDPRITSCVNSARLNLQMCTAATKQPYERSFCLAEHPLGEIAKCMAKTVR